MRILKIFCILALMLSMASIGYAEEIKRKAKVIEFAGNVEVRSKDADSWRVVEEGTVLSEGDIIKTGSDSNATLNLNGMGETATVDIEENSQLMLSELLISEDDQREETLLDLAIGKILIKAKKLDTADSRFEVKTPTSIVGVRGTEFAVEVEALE